MKYLNFVLRYNCTCAAGFTGFSCEENIDDCQLNSCQQYEQCVDSINSHQCVCPVGKTGQRCSDDIDYCSSHTCLNGATCSNSQGERKVLL